MLVPRSSGYDASVSDEAERGESPPASDDRLSVRGPDQRSAQIQLAARWAEMYASDATDPWRAKVLRTYRTLHDYIDAVIRGVEPPPQPD